MPPEERTILILSHFFAPYGLIGAKRASYLAAYLSARGYRVIVLKAHNDHYNSRHMGQPMPSGSIQTREIRLPSPSADQQTDRIWYRCYRKEICSLLRHENISCLYISGNPFFYFPLGAVIKKKFEVPYLLDFRDPWYQDRRLRGTRSNIFSRLRFYRSSFWDRIYEGLSVKQAAYVINVTRKRTEIYRRYYRSLNADKFITIPNGYDETLVPGKIAETHSAENRLNVGIFGKFSYYSTRHVDTLLAALQNLPPHVKCTCHHWGAGSYERYLMDQVRKHRLSANFQFHGHRDYDTGLQELGQMDCLLINNRDKAHFPTKIYDYIWLNKPVIALLSPGSELADWLARFRHAYRVDSALELSHRLGKMARLSLRHLDTDVDVARYSRRHAANLLLPFLEKAMTK